MDTRDLAPSLVTLLSELTLGAPRGGGAYVLNGGDPGLLASLDRLSAEEASRSRDGGATIAAHVEHLTYGISLMNRWAGGEPDPFTRADWAAAWRTTTVDEPRWAELRRGLDTEVRRWLDALGRPRQAERVELEGMIGSVIHLAYHLGAIRQIAAGVRGPKEQTRPDIRRSVQRNS